MNMTNATSLKALLSCWKLPELLPQLQDEGIGIEELLMMKPHHIAELLRSYKLGTRIRFEYQFERWRNDQYKPLLESTTKNLHYPPTITLSTNSTQNQSVMAHRKFQSRATNTVTVRHTTVATNTEIVPAPTENLTSPPPSKSTKDLLKEIPKLVRQPSLLEEATTDTSCPALTPTELNFWVRLEGHETETGPLLHILNSSGFKGQSLTEYYKQHKQLTDVHRTLLIQLIVNFFDINEYHLSLRVSHSLEQQILKLFPTEKLEYYRTEKRGKIYVKFCNMKRYKRDKPVLKRKWLDDTEFDDAVGNAVHEPELGITCGDEGMEQFAQSFEAWHAQQSPGGLHVKSELMSEGEF